MPLLLIGRSRALWSASQPTRDDCHCGTCQRSGLCHIPGRTQSVQAGRGGGGCERPPRPGSCLVTASGSSGHQLPGQPRGVPPHVRAEAPGRQSGSAWRPVGEGGGQTTRQEQGAGARNLQAMRGQQKATVWWGKQPEVTEGSYHFSGCAGKDNAIETRGVFPIGA
jgi:hypothetical protein